MTSDSDTACYSKESEYSCCYIDVIPHEYLFLPLMFIQMNHLHVLENLNFLKRSCLHLIMSCMLLLNLWMDFRFYHIFIFLGMSQNLQKWEDILFNFFWGKGGQLCFEI